MSLFIKGKNPFKRVHLYKFKIPTNGLFMYIEYKKGEKVALTNESR